MGRLFAHSKSDSDFLEALSKAIASFPINSWLDSHGFKISSGDEKAVYIDCPICDGDRKLRINRVWKQFHCFRCCEGEHGGDAWLNCAGPGRATLVQFIALTESITKKEACKRVFEESGLTDDKIVSYVKEIPDSFLPEDAIPLAKAHRSHEAVQTLIRRHASHLIDRCFICIEGRYHSRIIIPAMWLGKQVGFEAKAISKDQYPKTLYPEWFQTSKNLYSTEWDDKEDYAIVTESILDAETIKLNAVGLYGSVLTEGRLSKLLELRKLGVKRLVWMLDKDAWNKQAKASLGMASSFFENYTVLMPDTDPNDSGPVGCEKILSNLFPLRDELDYVKLSIAWGRKI